MLMADVGEVAPPGGPARAGWLAGAAGAALGIAGLSAISRLVGFGRTVVFARTVGATCLGDTYVTSNTVPNILFEVVAGGALASLVVPVLAGPAARGERAEASRTASALMSWALLLAVPLMLLGLVLAKPIVELLVGSTPRNCSRHDEIVVGTRMLIIFMPQVVLYAIGVVLTGVLQAHRRFLGPAGAPLLSSVLVIVAYLIFGAQHQSTDLAQVSLTSQLILAVGTTLGVVALALPLWWPTSKLQLRLRPTLHFPHAVGPRVARLAFAGAVTLAAQQLSVGVVLRLAHRGDGGTLVLYNLAWAVFLVPWSVLAVPIATSAFPRLSQRAVDGENAFADAAAPALRIVVAVTAAAAAALCAAALPAARVLVLHVPGNGDTAALAWALAAFAPGLLGYGLVAYVGRALYARNSWKFAAVAICAGWLVVIVADVALVGLFAARWRVVALGIGNSLGMTVAGVLLLYGLGRATAGRALAGLRRTGPAAVVGAVLGVAAGLAVGVGLGRGSIASAVPVALWAALVGGGVAFGVVWLVEPRSERDRWLSYLRRPRRRAVGGEAAEDD